MSDVFERLTTQYDDLKESLPSLEKSEVLAKARGLLEQIREAGSSVSNPEQRRILSNMARDLGEILFEIEDFYPSVRLKPLEKYSEGQQLSPATTLISNTKCTAKIVKYDPQLTDLSHQGIIQLRPFSPGENIVYCATCKNCFSLAGWQAAIEKWGGVCSFNKEVMIDLDLSDALGKRNADTLEETLYNAETVPHLFFELDGKQTRHYLIEDEVTIGRQDACSITLSDRKVSRLHARIVKDNHGFKLFNESPNGTLVNQQRIGMKGSIPLQDGNRIKIADIVFEFVDPHSPEPEVRIPSDEPWKLVYYLEGSVDNPEKYQLNEDEVSIGRRGDQTIRIDDDAVSREHARIFFLEGHYYIEDLSSAYGVHIDGRRLEPHRSEMLREGDRIKIGRHIFHFSQKPINIIREEIEVSSHQSHDQTISSWVDPKDNTTTDTTDRSQPRPFPISANPGWPAIVGLITLAILLSLVMGGFAFLLGQNLPGPLAALLFGTPTPTVTLTPTASPSPTFTATIPLPTTPASVTAITKTPTPSPTPTSNPEPSSLSVTGLSVPGQLQPGQERWFTFTAPEENISISIIFTPDVNRVFDSFRLIIYEEKEIESWPPEQPTIFALAYKDESPLGGGKLLWEGSLQSNSRYYIRIINESEREVDYCLSLRNESVWTCR